MADKQTQGNVIEGETFINRELSWLQFARRVLELAHDESVPLLERVRYAGILGMLHDEFFMKRMSGLKRQIQKGVKKISLDGRTPEQEYAECRAEVLAQVAELSRVMRESIRPALAGIGHPILDYKKLSKGQKAELEAYFKRTVLPILTPLAVDAEHPFPFISGLGLNLAVVVTEGKRERFIRIKVPPNRQRWVPVQGGDGSVPLEQVIAANLGLLFPKAKIGRVHLFRLTRGAEAEEDRRQDADDPGALTIPGNIVEQVASELKARRASANGKGPIELMLWTTKHCEFDLMEIKSALAKHPGDTPVLLHFQNSAGRRVTVAANEAFNVKRCQELESALGRWMED